MIYLLFLIDILINNFTKYTSYFFIVFLYNKPYKCYLLVGLILDLIVFDTYFYNLIILTIIYFLNRLLSDLNKNNFYNYVFINAFNYLMFIILTNSLNFNNIENILLILGSNLLVNILFYILSYRICKT